ncbi:hypothetical protein LX36DRAFT_580251 [Colletotrichum falcatum]|nr:hypothetical protein LX36DRAFT_580251 [Colletotrichum falcatum]
MRRPSTRVRGSGWTPRTRARRASRSPAKSAVTKKAVFANGAESDKAIAKSNSSNPRRDHTPAPPELAVPEVVLRHPPSDFDDDDDDDDDKEEAESPETAQKSALGVPGPVYASTYTNSPSWMSTYTSSTRATTHTTTHERARRDGDVDRDWLDVRSRRPPYPRRPRASRWGDAGAAVWRRRSTWRGGFGTGSGPGIEVAGWDAAEIEGGSYCVLEGERWEEQKALAKKPRQQRQQQQQKFRSQKGAVGKGKRSWRGKLGRLADVSRARSLPLVEPPTPRYVYDVFLASASGTGAEGLGVPYVSGKGHARAVYSISYVRGTGSARGPWGMFAPRDDGSGGPLGVVWREGVLKGILGCMHGVLGLGRGCGWMEDVD